MALATLARGDARRALNSLEVVADYVAASGEATITVASLAASQEHATLHYDKTGEEHHNVASAFIKSMRGSDPDAVLYWLETMI